MHCTKKAEMGVGTLIVFIAMLLVAAVAAGVLIQTAGTLQERALLTGGQARSQISTNVRVIEVSAHDGRYGNLTDFKSIMKLSPGSDPIKLDQTIFTFNTKDMTSTLRYRGPDGRCIKSNENGYNTWNAEEMGELENFMGRVIRFGAGTTITPNSWTDMQLDLDDDGATDYIRTCAGSDRNCSADYNNTHAAVNLSTDGIIYVQLLNRNGTQFDLTDVNSFDFDHLPIGSYGYINGNRSSGNQPYQIGLLDPDINFQFFENPVELEEDYDDDRNTDYFAVNSTHGWFFLSSGGNITFPLGDDISAAPATILLEDLAINNLTGREVASITVSAITAGNDLIPEEAEFTITAHNLGQGYFTAIYEQAGTNHVPGNLQRGDIIRLCYESPGEVLEDETVRLNFIPKIGTPTLTEFVTPDVISTERAYLYP